MPSEIQIPFSLNADGRIAVVTDTEAVIKQHAVSLINTEPGERVIYTDYGVPLAQALFEPDIEELTVSIGDDVATAFDEWEPGIRILNVTTQETNVEADIAGFHGLRIDFARADAPQSLDSVAVSSNTATIGIGGQVSEVIRG